MIRSKPPVGLISMQLKVFNQYQQLNSLTRRRKEKAKSQGNNNNQNFNEKIIIMIVIIIRQNVLRTWQIWRAAQNVKIM